MSSDPARTGPGGAALFGRSLSFPPRVDASGAMVWSAGEENINESIAIILKTARGERVMLPDFGASLGEFLFQPNTPATHAAIAHAIRLELARWEPRIRVAAITVGADPDDATAATVLINWTLAATAEPRETRLTLPLERA
jgi:hypothetical protein